MKNTRFNAIAISLILLGTSAGIAQAHSTLAEKEATAGSFYKASLRIPHGCSGKATTEVRVDIPEGFVLAQPQAKAGWKITTQKGDYSQPLKFNGKDITSGVTQVVWSDGNLPSDHFDEFTVVGKIADFDKDTTLFFPVTQLCGTDAEVSWTEIAQDEQDPHKLKNPAPQLYVHASSAADHGKHAQQNTDHNHNGHQAANVKLGELNISDPSIRAMVPGAKVAGGFMTITNEGKEPDRLVSATTEAVKRVEIHEMTMENQIMKMRKLSDGLEIPAGETVELKSGGYHLMFIEPDHPYKEGERVPVTLEFEKAGKAQLEFSVTSKSASNHDEHSHH